ncbi:tyrosine-type recombinase/integrase [Myxococcota bacterium]
MPKRPKLTKRRIDALTTSKPGGERTYCGALGGFGIHVLPSGRKSFFLEYTAPGSKRRRRMKLGTFGDLTLQEARDERRRVLGMVREGVDPLEDRKREAEAGTFAIWADKYLELGQAANRWAPRTLVEVRRHLRRACEAFGDRSLTDLDAPTIERWRDRLHEEHGLTEANKSLSSVKACLTEAWKRGLIDASPAGKVGRIAGQQPRTRTLTDSEMKALLAALDAHHDPSFRVAMLWLVLTGARRSEVLRARWGDLRLDPPDRAEWTIPKAKNKRPSVRPLPAELAVELKGLTRDSVLVIGRWTDHQFDAAWAKLRMAAGLPQDVHLHDLRRTAGLWIARTAGLQAAQRLLGHADISTTARVYSPLTVDDLRGAQDQAVAKILPFRRKAEGEDDGG